MLAHEIKQYIVENNLLIPLLEKMEFHNIKERQTNDGIWVSCSWKDGDNPNGVNINKETLFVKTFTHTSIKSDIIELVSYIYNLDFLGSLKKLHELLDIPYTKAYKKEKDKVDILAPLRKYKSKDVAVENKTYSIDTLKSYKQTNWIEWVKQGISNNIAKEFLICYDPLQERMLIPYRALDPKDNAIIGITGRSLLSAEVCKEFNIPKYLCVLPFKKTQTLYGYAENYSSIITKGEVVVGESEKMVLQRASLFDRTCLAIGGHDLSKKQIQLLIGLNVDIVLALDKDVTEQEVRKQCMKFKGIRTVYYIIDKDGLLDEKDAPVDKGDKIYKKLYKQKIKFIPTEQELKEMM